MYAVYLLRLPLCLHQLFVSCIKDKKEFMTRFSPFVTAKTTALAFTLGSGIRIRGHTNV